MRVKSITWIPALLGVLSILNVFTIALAATTSGSLEQDEVWSGEVEIIGDVTIPHGISLTIEPGTVVRFADGTGLQVQGVFHSTGNAQSPVIFTSRSATPSPGMWKGIEFGYWSGDTGSISHSIIEYAETGISCNSGNPTILESTLKRNGTGIHLSQSYSLQVRGCVIIENDECGIYGFLPSSGQPVIENNHIARCGTGIFISGGYGYSDPIIRGNIVRDSAGVGIHLDYVHGADVSFNTVVGNSLGLEILSIQSTAVVSSNIVTSNVTGINFSSYLGMCSLSTNDFWNNDEDYSKLSAGEGDISSDPLFAGRDDFHLQPGSPCIDAGDPALSDPDGSRSDMGAYGGGGSPPPESGDAPPNTPANTFPADGAYLIPSAGLLGASPFADPDPEDTHAASRWLVRAESGTYADPAYDSGETGAHLTTLSIPLGTLDPARTYFWRVRFKDSRSGWSAYSQETSFTTPEDLDPPDTLITCGPAEGSIIARSSLDLCWQGQDDFRGPWAFSYSLDSTGSWSSYGTATYRYFSGLPDGPHTVFVRARDPSGNVDPTPAARSFTVDTVTPAITNVRVSQITYSSAVISWETSEPATSQIRYGLNTGYGNTTPLDGQFLSDHSVMLENLYYNTTYHFTVQSRDPAGNHSPSQDFTFKTVPANDVHPPDTSISGGFLDGALVNTRDVLIGWRGWDDITPSANLTYSTNWDSAGWSTYTSITSRSFTNLPDGLHTLQVRARDQSGKVDPTPVSRSFTVDGTAPEPASDFTAQIRLTGADLEWEHSPSSDVQAYRIYWDGGQGTIDYSAPHAVVSHPSRMLSATLPERGIYRFGIRAVDRAGNEEPNAHLVVSAALTRPDAPGLQVISSPTTAPTQLLSGTKDSGTSLWINSQEVIPLDSSTAWACVVHLAPGVNRFEIGCKNASGEASPTVIAVIEYDPLPLPVTTLRATDPGNGSILLLDWSGYNEAGQGDIRFYRIYVSEQPFGGVVGMSPVATVPAGVFKHTVSSLIRGQSYSIAVVAVDTRGNANPVIQPIVAAPNDREPPEDISGLTVQCFADRLLFSWTASAGTAGDLAGYRVYFNGQAAPAELPPHLRSYEAAGLARATSYPMLATAVDASGNESAGVAMKGITLLENPANLTVEPHDGRVSLSWTDSTPRAYVAKYLVYVSSSPFSTVQGMTPHTQVGGTSAGVAGLTNGATCHVAVTALNLSGGERKEVTTASATPQGDREGPTLTDVRFDNVPIASGGVLPRSGTFSVAATDPAGVSRVEFLIDGGLRHTVTDGTSRCSYPWNIASVEDGSHVFTFRATDTLGNASRIDMSLEVKIEPPDAPTLLTPASGALVNGEAVNVSGRAEPGSEVLFIVNNVQTGNPAAAGSGGAFSSSLALLEGENRIQAAARNRGGTGPRSPTVTVTRDSTLPESPRNLSAELLSGGTVRLSWRSPSDAAIRGYNLYRATSDFAAPAQASKINGGLLAGTTFENFPPEDGDYVYRASTVDWAGNESELSNAASVVIDRTAPRAASIQFTPGGPFDPSSGRMGPGLVNLRLTVTEPLLTTPFLTITPHEGLPMAVDLTRSGGLEYSGIFTLTEATPSGTAYVVFSARDLAGNRGTEIDAGATLLIDSSGPSVSQINIQPGQPVRNHEGEPVSLAVELALTEPVQPGAVPELSFLLSAPGRQPVGIEPLEAISPLPGEAQRWRATFGLPPDAGLSRVENLQFAFRGPDDLGNIGTRILCENRFQVYQGELPPLEPPQGFSGSAMPEGRVKLNWQAVQGAADYQLTRKGPGEPEPAVLDRSGGSLEYIDTPPSDGVYTYAVSSVRRANGQEAVSGQSAEVAVEADSLPPNPPRSLNLELLSRGVNAQWQVPDGATEPVTYSLYRADATEIVSVDGLAPIIQGIRETTVLDSRPSATDHCYVVTAVDGAGNESPPSHSAYLNFGLLPVSTLKVVQNGEEPPVVSWTPPASGGSSAVAGYRVRLTAGGQPLSLTPGLVTLTSVTDTGFSGDERIYTVFAVDGNGVESPGRSITLPVIHASLEDGEVLRRGVMNRLEHTVENRSSAKVEHARLQVQIGSRSGLSEEFSLEAGERRSVPLAFGGFADLPDTVEMSATLTLTPHEGETVHIVRSGQVEVADGALRLRILNEELTRGASGTVRFVLENTGEEAIEIVTATGSGSNPSSEISLKLKDTDGNVLSSRSYRQVLGNGVVTLSNGSTVARIAPGATFTSDPVDLPVPLSAPDRVEVQAAISRVHFHQGKPEQVTMAGIDVCHEVTLLDTSYSGSVTHVSPQVSNGDQDILISGHALDRGTGLPVAQAPLKLVISVNGFERTSSVLTDGNGAFTFTFRPLPLESGHYKVFAVHPDVQDKPSQGQFVINRVTVKPQTLQLNIPKNLEKSAGIEVAAGDGTHVRNLRLVCEEADQPGGRLPEGVHLTVGAPVAALESRSTARLAFSVWADNTADSTATIIFQVQSDETGEGAWGRVTLNLTFSEAQPLLFTSPTHIETGVTLDGVASESLSLENRGLSELKDVVLSTVSADGSPAPPWVHLNAESNLGDLAVGEKRTVGLSFMPGSESVQEGIHTFYLRVVSSNTSKRDIPLYATVTQSGVGNALFKVSDIYTGTVDARGQIVQGLKGATLTLQNEQVLTVQRTLPSDALGEALFTGLPAGRYKVRITAPNHQDHIGRLWVKPGVTAVETAFLEYNLVTVEWAVEETTIQDKYEIVLKATFETNVPAPVVVAEPASVHLPQMKAGEVYFGEFSLANYGLVRAENVRFETPDGGGAFRYEFLSEPPSILNARDRASIPFRITCLQSFSPSEDGGASGGGCARALRNGRVTYGYICANGQSTTNSTPYCVIHETGDCGGTPTTPGVPGGDNGGGTWIYTYPGPSGPPGPAPAPSPQPIEGVKCWPMAPRQEEWDDTEGECRPETKQDVFQEVGSSVNCLLREYHDSAVDLSVTVPGGVASVRRNHYVGRWQFEHLRQVLATKPDSMGVSVQSVNKGGVEYRRSSSGGGVASFSHGSYSITERVDGHTWKDKHGNWKTFDHTGKMTAYGTANGLVGRLIYDPEKAGRLAGIEDRNGRQVIWYEYGAGGNISAAQDIEGRRVEYGYILGKLSTVKDVLGNITTYEYGPGGRMVKKTDPLGRSEAIAYDRQGSVRSVVDDEGRGYFFDFDYDEGRQEYYAQIKLPSGLVKEVWYDREGDTKRVDLSGRTFRRIVKDGRHHLITDEAGNVTRKEYDEWRNLTRVVHPDGATVAYEVEHTLNRPLTVVDERGFITQYSYDSSGNMIEKVEAAGTPSERTTRFTHDSAGNVTSVTGVGDENTLEAVARMEYDASGNLAAITEPEGAVTRFTCDSMGNVLTRTDPAEKTFTFGYDDAGRMTSAADPMGHRTELVYDAVGNRVRVIDAEGKASSFEYDVHNRLVKAVNAAGDETLLAYNAAGRLIRRTDAEGRILDYEYDPLGRVTAAIDGNGNVIRVEYADTSGCSTCRGGIDQPSRIIYPTFVRELKYDSRGRRIEELEVAEGIEPRPTRFVYDAAGNITAVIDRDSKITRYATDALGRLAEVMDPSGSTAKFLYDDRDSLVALIDANGNRMRFEYDRNNRMVREIRPMGQETSYLFDSRGELVRQADPKNQVAFYIYDDAGRLAELRTYGALDHASPVKTVSFSYDRVGNLKGYDDGATSARYEYDDAHRKIFESVNYGHIELSSATSWYRNGRKSGFTGPDGVTYGYTYDGNNQLSSVEIPDKGLITINAYSWLRPAKVTLPGGTTREYAYDPLMRLKGLEVKDPAQKLLMSHTYSHDTMDRITARKTEHGDYQYTYDDLYRLIKSHRPDRPVEELSYDGAGNRLSADAVRGAWSHNANNELQGFEGTAFSYDSNGNMEEKRSEGGVIRYIHNVEDQLERVETESGGVISQYSYDPFGRRLWKEVGGQRTYFFYADEGLIGEYDAAGSQIRSYGFRPGSLWTTDPLFMKEGFEYYYYQNDHLGTPMMMTASSGRVVWSARYAAFGEAEVDPASLVTNNLRFAGQYYDSETGLHYNYHRTYHPGLGRYLEPDPLGVSGGLNLYSYVLDPVNSIDPLGLFQISWGDAGEGLVGAATGMLVGIGIAAGAMLLAPAVVAALPCAVVSAGALMAVGYLGWRTGQAITGDRIEFSWSDWQFHVRRMCDDERSKMLGEVLFEWATLGLVTPKGLKFCFEAGTPVMTDHGLVPIEDLKPGDRVLSRDDQTGKMVHRKVAQVFVTPDQPIYELKLSDDRGKTETFHSTGDHPFFQRESGWMRAADLLPGDEIFTSLGGWLRVSGGTWTERRATVYNIEVEDTHTYFVGHVQAWVHNVCTGVKRNPYGKLGSPRHQAYVEDEVRSILTRYSNDSDIIVKTEIRIIGGDNQVRYIDVQAKNVRTNEIIDQVQVGRTNKNGIPVARERRNMEDIDRATRFNTRYRSYDR